MRESLAILTGLVLLCSPVAVAAQALDTSVTIQVRTRRASTGKTTITTTIVKVPAAPVVTVSRVDTVVVEHLVSPARYFYWKPVFKVDTLRLFLDTSASSGAYPVGFPAYGLTCQNPTTIPAP